MVEDWVRSLTVDAVIMHSRQFVALVLLVTLHSVAETSADAVIFGGTVATFAVTTGGMVLYIVDCCPMLAVVVQVAVAYMQLAVPMPGSYVAVPRSPNDREAFADPAVGSLDAQVVFDVVILMLVDAGLAKHSPHASYWDAVGAPEHDPKWPVEAVDWLVVGLDSVAVPSHHAAPPDRDDVFDFVNGSVGSLHGSVAVVTDAPPDSDDAVSVAEMICGSD